MTVIDIPFWFPMETAPKNRRIDILCKKWRPTFDDFIYYRFAHCQWMNGDPTMNIHPYWMNVDDGWYPIAWAIIPKHPVENKE